jgi:hypothetical protein
MEALRRELRAQFIRTCRQIAILVAISWLFSAFSFIVTRKSGTDWFTRSGAIMALVGAIATFRLTALKEGQLATGLKEGLGSVTRGFELSLDPPEPYQVTAYFSYLTGVVGTLIWGYGDVLSRWVSSLFGGS